MTVSALAIGVNRILASEDVVGLLGASEEGVASVFPVQVPKGAPTPAVTVNRLFERTEGGETSAVVAFTVLAKTLQEVETIGATLIEDLDGTTDFAFGGLQNITSDKGGPDVTGFDAGRNLFLRQIEFLITF